MAHEALLSHRIRCAYKEAHLASRQSLAAYLDRVVIDCLPEPRRFGLVREPWQTAMFGATIPALESVAGVRKAKYAGPLSFWFTLPKGHDKTTGEGRLLNWLLAYARRKTGLNLYAAATDRDQAALVLDAMKGEATLNPWLRKRINYNRTTAIGSGGNLTMLTSDAASNQGLRPDVVVMDEVTCWKRPDLYTALVSGCAKRPGSVMVVITNAGVRGSWQHDRLAEARLDPRQWYVYEAPEGRPLATWMSADRIAALRRQLPPGEAARLYDNRWTDPGEEDGYLRRDEAAACEAWGRDLGLTYRPAGVRGVTYYAAIDYGPKKDRTVMCVVHYDPALDAVVVDRMDVFQGTPTDPVKVSAVEGWVEAVGRQFASGAAAPTFVIDQYQMEGTIQKYEGSHRIERFEFRGGKKNYEMAECLRTLVTNRKIAWYGGCGGVTVAGVRHALTDELAELVVRRMSYGYRFDHESGKHDDRAVALGMAALACLRDKPAEFAPPRPAVAGGPDPTPTQRLAGLLHAEKKGLFGMGGGGR